MNYKFMPCFLLCVLLFSCSAKRSELYPDAEAFDFSDFSEITELVSENLDLDTLDIVPIQIEVFDGVLISRNRADEKLFTIVDLKKKAKVADYVDVGQGPEDMLYPSFAGYDNDYIYISDDQTSTVNIYRLNDMLGDNGLHSVKKVALGKRLISGSIRLKNGYIGSVYDPEWSHYFFNENGEVTDSIRAYPNIGEELTTMEKLNTFMNKVATNGKDRIAICYMNTDLIDFRDNEGKLLKRLNGPKQFMTRFEEVENRGMISSKIVGGSQEAFMNPKNINDELWVLYSGINSKDPDYEYSYNYILTFGWNGNLRQAYHLDHGVFDFTVDVQNKVIYAITDTPDTHILTFNF